MKKAVFETTVTQMSQKINFRRKYYIVLTTFFTAA